MSLAILICYFSILGILCIYGLHRLHITRLYGKYGREIPKPAEKFEELPLVTIQLPVFNEVFVVERLIDAVAAFRYPKDRLQIQVLDDSTDETVDRARARTEYYQKLGLNIQHIHRTDRTGFKAGALAAGLETAIGEFVAVFDADFLPDPDFLEQTIHYFTDNRVGMVQARWEHINRDIGTLTQVQAMMLDAHFVIEHGGRCFAGLFFNFNGTGGIWRRQAILDAGGWQHDTLTEDLDLSYRAQLKGWRFLFVQNVTCPSELPSRMTAFKTQQHRWAKGSIEVMLKLLPKVLSSNAPLRVKVEAFFHLTGNLAYVLMIINSTFFVIPSMMLRSGQAWWHILLLDGPLFMLASLSFVHFYLSAQRAIYNTIKGKKRFIPALMAIGIGLGVNNSRAVLEALFGYKTAFIRTPKTGETLQKQPTRMRYRLPKNGWGFLELLLGFMYSCGIVWAIILGNWGSIPFLLLFQNGFYFIGWQTVSEEWGNRKQNALPAT